MTLLAPRRRRICVGIHNRSRNLAGSPLSASALKEEPSSVVETVRDESQKIADEWLRKREKRVQQKSDFTLRPPRDRSSNRFQPYQFDRRIGGRDPRVWEDPKAGFAAIRKLQEEIISVYGDFGVDLKNIGNRNAPKGVSFGFLEGDRDRVCRRPTGKSAWVFHSESVKQFLSLAVEKRGGQETVERANLILYWFYHLSYEDQQIQENFPHLFKTIVEIKSLRQRTIRQGFEMFGNLLQDIEEDWNFSRENDPNWKQFREQEDQRQREAAEDRAAKEKEDGPSHTQKESGNEKEMGGDPQRTPARNRQNNR